MPSLPPGRASAVADAAGPQLRASPRPSDSTAPSPSPVARKAGRRPISLEDVLGGRTRAPFGFKDFERFLRDKELTVENLHFVVWFQSYSLRFRALPADVKSCVVVPRTVQGDHWADTGSVRRAWMKSRGLVDAADETVFRSAGERGRSSKGRRGRRPSLPSDPLELLRKETRRIAATFVRTGAPKELNLTDSSRERILRDHAETVHPDVFLPAYEEAYAALETNSLGHFSTLAAERATPRTLLWLGLGILALLCSVATFLLTVLLLPKRPFGWRAVRLASVVFAFAGSTTTYAAARGHLVHLNERHAAVLDPWRLEEGTEAPEFNYPAPPKDGHSPSRSAFSPTELASVRSPDRSPRTRSLASSTSAAVVLENEIRPWPLSLWGNSPAPYRTWKRGHLPPPLAAVLDTARDLLSSAFGSSDNAYLPMPTEDPAPAARVSPPAAANAPDDAPAPVRTWKRGHVPPASTSPTKEHKSPAVRFAPLPSPSKDADRPLPVDEQVFSAAFILDASPPPVSNWGKRGHLPSSAPPPRRSSRAAIVPDWDVSFRTHEQPEHGTKGESQRRPSARSRPSLAGPVALHAAKWQGRLKVAALEVLLIGLVYTACWIALCLAVPSPS